MELEEQIKYIGNKINFNMEENIDNQLDDEIEMLYNILDSLNILKSLLK